MEHKSNILVVDDNPDKLHLLEAALRLAGYSVTTATDGDEALSSIETYQNALRCFVSTVGPSGLAQPRPDSCARSA